MKNQTKTLFVAALLFGFASIAEAGLARPAPVPEDHFRTYWIVGSILVLVLVWAWAWQRAKKKGGWKNLLAIPLLFVFFQGGDADACGLAKEFIGHWNGQDFSAPLNGLAQQYSSGGKNLMVQYDGNTHTAKITFLDSSGLALQGSNAACPLDVKGVCEKTVVVPLMRSAFQPTCVSANFDEATEE